MGSGVMTRSSRCSREYGAFRYWGCSRRGLLGLFPRIPTMRICLTVGQWDQYHICHRRKQIPTWINYCTKIRGLSTLMSLFVHNTGPMDFRLDAVVNTWTIRQMILFLMCSKLIQRAPLPSKLLYRNVRNFSVVVPSSTLPSVLRITRVKTGNCCMSSVKLYPTSYEHS